MRGDYPWRVMPVVQQTPAFEAAESLMTMMLALATDGDAQKGEYQEARNAILSDSEARRLAPGFVKACRDPGAFWAYIKAEYSGSGSWQARREFIREGFGPLFQELERFEESPVDSLAEEASQALSAASVTSVWRKAVERRNRDPDGAITAARTLLESVCKTILDDAGVEYGADNLPTLYKKVCMELRLAPSDYTERQFKQVLGGCASVVEGLGGVRNRDSDSHGQGRRSYRPAPRHAALAVNLAGSMAVFLIETWEDRRADDPW